jgi:hypothetical protein
MVRLSYLFSALACTALYPAVGTVSARQIDRKHIQALQREAANSFGKDRLAVPSVGGDVRLSAGVKNFTFSNLAASGECHASSCHRTLDGVLTVGQRFMLMVRLSRRSIGMLVLAGRG